MIGLGLVILFLLSVIDGARRYHNRRVEELNAEHASEIREREGYADRIDRLNIVYGMAVEARDLVLSYSIPLPKEALEWLDSNIKGALQHCFGAQGRDEYYQGMRPIPDSADEQRGWIYYHRERLNAYIEHQQRQLDALKSKPKQLPRKTSASS